MGKWRHRLVTMDGDHGVCALCGPVPIKMKPIGDGKTVPRCASAVREQKGRTPSTPAGLKERADRAAAARAARPVPAYRSISHGLSAKEAQEFCEGKTCAICGSGERLVVDHSHAVRQVRGVLCHHCNLALGHFRDSTERLQAAIKYLDR